MLVVVVVVAVVGVIFKIHQQNIYFADKFTEYFHKEIMVVKIAFGQQQIMSNH